MSDAHLNGFEESPNLHDDIARAAECDLPVLLSGEPGAGKQAVAHAIHDGSVRRLRPFVSIECRASSASLDQEFFGSSRSESDGSRRERRDVREAAAGGTLLFREVSELSPDSRALLMELLESDIGRHHAAPFPSVWRLVRVMATTQRDLLREGFDHDLYYRLNAIHIVVPPLRERLHELPSLLATFLAEAARARSAEAITLAPEVMDTLARYHWPGNIRELRQLAHTLTANERGSVINVDSLPTQILRAADRG